MITPQDKEAILRWKERIVKDIPITLIFSDNKRRNETLKDFCDTLTSLLPQLVIQTQKAEGEHTPAIRIGDRLYYQAIPLGPELEPFMEVLILQGERPKDLPGSVQAMLDKTRVPTILKLFIAPQCPFCPTAVRTLAPLTSACEQIRLNIIDGTMFTEIAETEGIQSAPTLVFEDFRWSGTIQLEEVVGVIASRDPARFSSSTIRNLIQEGSASQIAHLMLEHKMIFPGLVELLMSEKWPVRLGAMVVVEEILDHDPALASQVVEPIWKRFHSLDEQAKGDAVYLMGETGTPDMISRLQHFLKETLNDELQTVVKEAIDSIKERHKKISDSKEH